MFRSAISFLPICLICFLVTIPTVARADVSIAGTYAVHGANPDGTGEYQGRVAVKPEGDVFLVIWEIGQDYFSGTGVLKGSQFAVVFQSSGGAIGLAHYEIQPAGSLVGVWVEHGKSRLGTETWTPAAQ
ncbi:MAG: hypothetical protein ACOCWR_06285 [Oceanidesulfovibrio sp.]